MVGTGGHPLEQRVLRTLRAEALAPPGSHGVVMVSGGPDSLALLHLLHAAAGPLGLRLTVLHCDHGLRAESAAEAAWVAEQARALGLETVTVRAEHLAGRHAGLQAEARAWRLAEAERLRTDRGADWIAVGHQREDHLETWLLKWLRGAHLLHLRGLEPRSGAVVRPLLAITRAELTAYLQARGLTWVEDPSNASPRYRRNRVRHELLPLLEALSGGGLGAHLDGLAEQGRALEAWLDAQLTAAPPPANTPDAPPHWVDATALAALPAPLQAHALHGFVQARLPGELAHTHVRAVQRLLAGGGNAWTLHLPGRRRLRRLGDRLLLEPALPRAGVPLVAQGLGPCRALLPHGWRAEALPEGGEGVLTLHGLPAGALLRVRARRPGDRFRPPWRERAVKLKDFLRDQGVPLWARDATPLLEWGGEVIAVAPRWVAAPHAAPGDGAAVSAPLHVRLTAPGGAPGAEGGA